MSLAGTIPPERPGPRFAVVFRLFQWDAFIARQAERYASVSSGGDFFLSVDETKGPIATDGGHRVFRTTNEGLVSLGLPDRFARGSLVWWNSDYPQYAFQQAHPDYDYYVFVEYDSLVRAPIADLVRQIAEQGLDLVSGHLREPGDEWFWRPHSRLAYPDGALHASLNCIMIVSGRALTHLFARRLAMGADPSVRYWPISEAFVPTEIVRADFRSGSLAEFGDDSTFDWFPPMLEDRLGNLSETVFVHPVLDAARARQSVIRHTTAWRDFLDRRSPPRQVLAALPTQTDALTIARAIWHSFSVAKRSHAWRRTVETGAAAGW